MHKHLLIILLASTSAMAQDIADLDTNELYIRRGDVVQVLPVLMAQCRAPAIMNFGKLPALEMPEPKDEYHHRWQDIELNPARIIEDFSFKNGKLREALNAFVKANPKYRWRTLDNTILVEVTDPQESVWDNVLNHRMPMPDDRNTVLRLDDDWLLNQIKTTVARLYPKTQKRLWIDSMSVGFQSHYAARVVEEEKYNIKPSDRTLLDAIVHNNAISPNHMWLLCDFNSYGVPEEPTLMMVHTNWSDQPSKWSHRELLMALDAKSDQTSRYKSEEARSADAKCELNRRFHFHETEIRNLLVKDHLLIDRLLRQPDDWAAQRAADAIFSLNDIDISTMLLRSILAIPPDFPPESFTKRRVRLFLGCAPTAPTDQFLKLLPLYVEIARNDTDKTIRDSIRVQIQWYHERTEYMKGKSHKN